MTFSTRGQPRLGQSSPALTSLGAVGGARGTAAGALRIFVEFLTTYDRKELETLNDDLRQIDHASNNSAKAEETRQKRLTKIKNDLAESERIVRGKLNTELRSDLKKIEELESSRSKTNRALGAQERQRFNQTAKSLGLTQTELQLIAKRSELTKEQGVLTARQAAAEEGQLSRARERAQVEGQLSKIQAGRASLAPKLAGLAIGAVGGIVGGAILGVGFQLAQTALEKIGDVIQDVIDPSRHAKEAIDQLGQSVLELARNSGLTLFEAATQKADELGLASDKTAVSLLQQFAAQKKANDAVAEYVQFAEAAAHPQATEADNIEKVRKALVKEAAARTDAMIQRDREAGVNIANTEYLAKLPLQIRTVNGEVVQMIDGQNSLTLATSQYNEITQANTRILNENVEARRRQADAAALQRIQQDTINNAIAASGEAATGRIDSKIAALGNAGPSARTRRLQGALDRASGGGGKGTRDALRNIAEERALILLRMRLRLLGTAINLEKYSGKFLLEAINAKIAAIEKEGQAQAHLNRQLDLQFKMSQIIRRQNGESIRDFLERRAQEQRQQLSEQRDLDRESQLTKLQEKQQEVQDIVALQELEQRKLATLRDRDTANHLDNLQKQLKASQKHDQEVLESKRRALEKEKKAIQDKVREATRLANQQALDETAAAIRGANNLEKLESIAGRIAGLQRAKGVIQGLVEGFALPPSVAAPLLARISGLIENFNAKEKKFVQNIYGPGKRVPFAKGGVIDLKNSRSPFGSNIGLGEQGSELGVVLSNRVTQQLKQQQQMTEQIGPFYFDRSDDRLGDEYRMKKMVREAVAEALR